MSDGPETPPPDPRRHAYREDLAAESLRGRVSAPRYTPGELRQAIHSATPLRDKPDAREPWTSEVLFGETVTVYEEHDGWAWVQLERDGYVGYLRASALSAQLHTPTHRVRALGSFFYPAPNVKAPPWMHVSMNSLVAVVEMSQPFARLAGDSFIPARHIVELERPARDYVAVAERFLGAPYLWGGRTRLGIDCSGLVQVALHAAGMDCPRDSDMQQAELGADVSIGSDLEELVRGDLVFWEGHVGIMADGFLLLHANAHHMAVVVEPVRGVADRVAKTGQQISAIKRLTGAAA